MKKISVIYATKTKHSKKIADTVASALGVTAQNIASSPVIESMDLLFIVGGIYGGESLPELKEYVSNLSSAQVKSAAFITSSVSNAKGQDAIRSILEGKGIAVVDEYRCFGSILVVRLGHPNKMEIQSAGDFAIRLAGKEA
jgi:flavodoxin